MSNLRRREIVTFARRGKFKDLEANLYFLKQIQIKHQLKGKSMNLISNPEQKKQIKNALDEISHSLTRIASEQDLIKEIKQNIFEEFKDLLTKKQINKMSKVYHKDNFRTEVQEAEDFSSLFESITGQKAED